MRKTRTVLLLLVGISGSAAAQKGVKCLSAGPLVAFTDNSTTRYNRYEYSWGNGWGFEVTGQSNITDKSAVLLQLQFTRFKGASAYTSLLYDPVVTPISLKAGYRYQFSTAGFYANVLAGLENGNGKLYLPAAVGAGKRIAVKDVYFIDAGIDFTGGFVSRFNVKAVFTLLQKNRN